MNFFIFALRIFEQGSKIVFNGVLFMLVYGFFGLINYSSILLFDISFIFWLFLSCIEPVKNIYLVIKDNSEKKV